MYNVKTSTLRLGNANELDFLCNSPVLPEASFFIGGSRVGKIFDSKCLQFNNCPYFIYTIMFYIVESITLLIFVRQCSDSFCFSQIDVGCCY